MSLVTVTKDNFDDLIKGEKPVLLDFWATWCGPCKMLAPTVHEIAEERDDVVVGQVNVDDEPELAMQFGIVSIPTLIVMKDGKPVAQSVGVQMKEQILSMLD